VEVVLQWLDEFEDLVFSVILTWERLRVRCLEIGFAAALILLAVEMAEVRTPWAAALAGAALGSVAFWFAALIAAWFPSLRRDSNPVSNQSNA